MDRIIDYFKYIDMVWPSEFPGLTIEYGAEGYGFIYAIVKYDNYCIKRVFRVDSMIDNYEYIKNTMQKIRDEVIEKGERCRNILRKKAERRNMLNMPSYFPVFYTVPKPKKIILNDPATIILWSDNTKTIVKKNSKDKKFDPEKGIALCYMKKALGNKGNYNNVFKDWIK